MNHGISNFMASLHAFIDYSANEQRFPKPVNIAGVNYSNSTFGNAFLWTEQTEHLFQTHPIYTRIIKHLDSQGLSNLKQAISQTKNMDSLILAIDANHKERLSLMCTPKEFDIDSCMNSYNSFKNGHWDLKLNVSDELTQHSYSNVPDIKKVHSFDTWGDMEGYGIEMSGVLVNGDIFHLYGDQSAYSSGQLVATMTIVPSWDALLTKLSPHELISFVRNMRTKNSPTLVAKLQESEDNQAELRAILIDVFSSTTGSSSK